MVERLYVTSYNGCLTPDGDGSLKCLPAPRGTCGILNDELEVLGGIVWSRSGIDVLVG